MRGRGERRASIAEHLALTGAGGTLTCPSASAARPLSEIILHWTDREVFSGGRWTTWILSRSVSKIALMSSMPIVPLVQIDTRHGETSFHALRALRIAARTMRRRSDAQRRLMSAQCTSSMRFVRKLDLPGLRSRWGGAVPVSIFPEEGRLRVCALSSRAFVRTQISCRDLRKGQSVVSGLLAQDGLSYCSMSTPTPHCVLGKDPALPILSSVFPR